MPADPQTATGAPSPGAVTTVEPTLEVLATGARLDGADSIVKNHVIGAMALGLVPLPLFDLVALMALQLKLVHGLAGHYGVPFSRNLGKALITSLVGSALPITATVAASSTMKWIPGIGSLAGGASMAILSGAITHAVGRVFRQHFESGGTLLDFNPTTVREAFHREIEAGKHVAQHLRDDRTQA